MTDPQMMTPAPAMAIPLSMLVCSNSGITEAKETLGAEIGLLEGRMESRFTSIDRKFDEIPRMVGDHETRIARLEQRPH